MTVLLFTIFSCKKDDTSPELKFDVSSLTLKVGERHQFVVSKGDKIYTVETFDWYSSDISTVSVNGSGQVYAGKVGKATITIKQKDVTFLECVVTVRE